MADRNHNDRESHHPQAQRERDHNLEDPPFNGSTRHPSNHFPSLFDTLWSLPSNIYQRGNEHGRHFNRILEEQRKEREEEQEREDGRGARACGWRGRRHWEHRHRRGEHDEREETEHDGAEERGNREWDEDKDHEWINHAAKTLEMNERKAQKLYAEQMRMMEDRQRQAEDSEEVDRKALEAASEWMRTPGKLPTFEEVVEILRNPEKSSELMSEMAKAIKGDGEPRGKTEVKKENEQSKWAEIFPAWSNRHAPARSEEEDSKSPEFRFGSVAITQKQAEEAFDKMNKDLKDMMSNATQLSKMFQDSYNRESRIFDEEGLFGNSFPFNRPLSTMFSLGMRPFLPQDSAMEYLLFSEYSPLHLEHEEGFDASYRKRFEDLVMVQSGREMRDNDEKESTKLEFIGRISQLLKGDGAHASQGFIAYAKDGHVRPVVQSEEVVPAAETSTTKVFNEHEQDDGPETEQDLHEQRAQDVYHPLHCSECGGFFSHQTALNGHRCRGRQLVQHAPSSSSSVLSTLTTTERHTDAEGNMTVKTVLKRRFADGREETETSTHTGHSPSAWARQRQLEASSNFGGRGNETAKEAKGGRGWFWSS